MNFFYADDRLYLIGTHDRYMDTYRIDIVRDSATGTLSLEVDKIADCKYPLDDATLGLFREGVAIQPLENNKMRIWCAPYDYRAGRCIFSWSDLVKCTHIWYFEKAL